MSERPIIFSAPMVKALLAGTKTQTRRIATSGLWGSAPRECAAHADFDHAWVDGSADNQYLHVPCHVKANGVCRVCDHWGWPSTTHRLWPRYQPGETLWVRESIRLKETWHDGRDDRAVSVYVADDEPTPADSWPWKNITLPSIHCPRGLSRITLRVTSVRVERLQEISREDEIAEGTPDGEFFDSLWDRINGKRAPWSSNPWVWVIGFERVAHG